jgi:tape measure domain-containing protein
MADETIWKLDIQQGNSQATLKAFENSLNAVKAQIGQVTAAGQNFEKLETFQVKAAEAGKRLEVAQASAAVALKKAQEAAAGGKASTEQIELAQARAALAAQKVETAENAVSVAMNKAQAEADRLAKAMQEDAEKTNIFGHAVESAKSGLSGMLGHITGMAGGLLDFGSKVGMTIFGLQNLYQGVLSFGSALIGSDESMEQTQVAFTQLLGSSKAAGAYLKQLQDFAASTPFEFPELAQDAQQMMAFGFSAQDVIPFLTDIGDAMGDMGKGKEAVSQIVTVFGQMHAAGKLNAQDMMQLTDTGIPAWKILADSMHLSVAQVQKMTTDGLIPADDAISRLRAGMHATFGGGMQAQSKTFAGLLSTVQDNVMGAWRAFTGPLFEQAKGSLTAIGNLVSSKSFQDFATMMGERIGGALKNIISIGSQVISFFQHNQIAMAALQGTGIALVAVLGAIAIAALAAAVAEAAAAWPILLIVAAIALLATGFILLYKNSAPFRVMLANLGALFMGIWSMLVANFMPAWKQLTAAIQQAMPALQFLGAVLLGVIIVALGLLIATLAGVAQGVAGAIGGIITVITGFVNIFSGVFNIVSGIIMFFVHLFTGQFSKLGGDLGQIGHGIAQIFIGMWQVISGVFSAGIGFIVGLVSGFVRGIITFFQGMYTVLVGHSIIPDMVNGIILWFFNLNVRAIQMVAQLVMGVWNWFAQLPGRAVSFLWTLPGMLMGIWNRVIADATNAGGNIVNGIANGIRGAISGVTNAMSWVGQQIAAHLPHSPAKVGPLRDLHLQGSLITEQISQGMLASMPKLNAAIGQITTPISTNLSVSSASGASSGSDPNTALLAQILAELQRQGRGGQNIAVNANVAAGSMDAQRINQLIQSLGGLQYEAVQRGAW